MSMLVEGEVAVVFPSRLSRSCSLGAAARALGLSVPVPMPEGLVLALPLPRSVVATKRGLWMRLAEWVGSMDCL